MELDDIEMKTTRSNDEIAYENLKISTESCSTESQSKEPYETLKYGDSDKRKIETGDVDTVKRLKYVIYVLIVLISVLYITLITLVIVLFVPKETVNGQWTHWSNWTSCDVTCGKGTRQRSRTCTNPVPDNGGLDCTGVIIETDECSNDACPVDGQWAYWSSWTSCDATCGLRTRRCTNPMPDNKGKDCIGESFQSRQCSIGNCPTFKSAFSVKSPDTNRYINGIKKLTFSSTIYQYGNGFNISTGTYTCNKPGVYHFSVTLVKKRSSSRVDLVYCSLEKNRQSLIVIKVDPTDDETDNGHAAISQSIVINLDVGDTVYLTGCSDPSTRMESFSSFTGFLLYINN